MEIISYFLSPELQEMLKPFKIFSIALSAVLFLATVFFLTQTPWLYLRYWVPREDFLAFQARKKGKMRVRWDAIAKRLDHGSEEGFRLAVSEADAMLKEILDRMNLPGETVEEELERADPTIFPSARRVAAIQEKRHQIIRNPAASVSREDAREVLDVYRQAFEDLDLL